MTRVLDCTLRDGGYYTNWDFDEMLVADYLTAVAQANIDMIELGLRNYGTNDYRGPYYFTTENFIESLVLPKGPVYGVMVDAKTVLKSGKPISESVSDLFVNSNKSKLNFVRVACHFDEVEAAEEIVRCLKALGYEVFINLMQISLRSNEELIGLFQMISRWEKLDGLYFADSLGNMGVSDVCRVIELIQLNLTLEMGIHAHNNMGLALSNTLAAMENGVAFLDATITGMGRGAGNTEMEMLIAELEARGIKNYQSASLATLILGEFKKLKNEHGWGPSLHYYIAAKNDIHPTYVQTILTDKHFSFSERVGSIEYMQKMRGKSSFDENLLSDFVTPQIAPSKTYDGSSKTLSSNSLEAGASALLIGAGDGVRRHKVAIRQFLQNSNASVFALNDTAPELGDLIQFRFISHNARQLNKRNIDRMPCDAIVAPLARFSADEIDDLGNTELFDFPMDIQNGKFAYSEQGCVIPVGLTAAYAFAAIAMLGFKRILLVGFDGFGASDPRQKEMSEVLHIILREKPALEIIALTPTTYPVQQGSIYAPLL